MSDPVTPQEFRALLAPLLLPLGEQGEGPLAVAVSGGGDSMALALLTDAAFPGRVQAFTVDHGLRAESAAEAQKVGSWLSARGIAHRVLRWQGEKPESALQAKARAARYSLLVEAAAELGPYPAPILAAHTEEDQAETFLLRLAHGSGLGGLAAMRAASELLGAPPVPLLRPLLGVSRARLRETLRAFDQVWIEDPSNDDPRFERVRLRCLAPALAEAGLTGPALARTSGLMGRLDKGLAAVLGGACAGRWRLAPEGHAEVDGDLFASLPPVMGRRFLADLLTLVGGEVYPPSGEALERLRQRLAGQRRGATLAGCRLWRSRRRWLIAREQRAAARNGARIYPGETVVWDRRFLIHVPETAGWRGGLSVRPLGGRAALDAALPALCVGQLLVGQPEIIVPEDALPEGAWAVHIGLARAQGALCALWRRLVPPDGRHNLATTVS